MTASGPENATAGNNGQEFRRPRDGELSPGWKEVGPGIRKIDPRHIGHMVDQSVKAGLNYG